MSLQDNDTPHDLLLRIALETLAVSRRESQMKICAGASYYRDQHQVEYTAREICVSTVVLAKGLAPLAQSASTPAEVSKSGRNPY